MKIDANFTVISGGQTGIDQLGLEIASKYGIPTGGFIAPGFMTEDGERPQLGEKYGICEMSEGGSIKRTKANVENSDATVVFGDIESPGSKLTLKHAIKKGKATLINPDATALLKFLSEHHVTVLNVAVIVYLA